jgi:AcrR family transcriptional regulator
MRRSAEQTRLRILDASFDLFWRQGFLRVSMDEIAARVGITKRALYQHFRSKDDLMAAVLVQASDLAMRRLHDFRRPVANDSEFIDSYFTQLGQWGAKPKYSGAGFTRVAVELADLRGHPARAIVRKHKLAVQKWITEELASTGVSSATDRAREVMLLTEGAMVLMLIHGDQSWAAVAAGAAKILIQNR